MLLGVGVVRFWCSPDCCSARRFEVLLGVCTELLLAGNRWVCFALLLLLGQSNGSSGHVNPTLEQKLFFFFSSVVT